MDLRRRSVALRFIFLACLVGLGWWLRPHETATAPTNPVRSSLPEQASPRLPAVEAASHETAPESPGPALATFKGRVVDADTREPIREFELRFVGAQQTKVVIEAPGARKFNTDDGRFEWQQLPAGVWTVTAEATGYQRFDLMSLQLTPGAATAEVVLPLRRGQILRGRIYDQTSQAGIASASIGFREADTGRFEGNWRTRPRVTSAKDGSFVLNGVPAGRVTLEVSANDHASREVDVVVADDTAPFEIWLSTGGLIAGRLTAADGVTPIKGYAGLFRIGDSSGFSAPTGEAGEFSFRNLTPGGYRLTGQVAGSNATREFEIADNERIEGVVLAVGAGRTVRGTVTGLRPAELQALNISAHPEGQFELIESAAEINERGEYELRGVQPGRVQVVADVNMRRQLSRTVEVPASSDVTVNFDFPRGARLSGRVTQVGKPVARTYLSPRPTVKGKVFNYGASTSATGEYMIEDLAPGEYVISVGDSFASRPVQVSGDTVFDIDVPPAQLAGRVVEEGGKVPVVGAQVDVWSTEAAGPRVHLSDRADHFGQFGLAGLEPGDFILVAHKAGYEMFRDRISYSAPIPEMKIELRRDAGIELRAHDASGKSPPHVWASEVIGDSKGVMLKVNLDENGVGYIPRALAGATIAFSAGGYTPLTVRAWNGKRLDLKLVRSTTTQ